MTAMWTSGSTSGGPADAAVLIGGPADGELRPIPPSIPEQIHVAKAPPIDPIALGDREALMAIRGGVYAVRRDDAGQPSRTDAGQIRYDWKGDRPL